MKHLNSPRIIMLFFIGAVTISFCNAQQYKRSIKNPERYLFGKSLNTKQAKYKESPSVVRAKKKQARNEKKLDKEYDAYVNSERKRAVKIQTPEVQARMLANRKESDIKYKEKRKKISKSSKAAGQKYN